MSVATSPLANKKCFIHRDREAVALCPECKRYFCRECITEHDGKVICQSCLDSLTVEQPTTTHAWRKEILASAGCILGILVLWFSFNLLGQILLKIPTEFHNGTFWNQN